MAADEIHEGDIGTVFEITVKDGENIIPINVTLAININFIRPDEMTTLTRPATLSTDGLDGKMFYKSVAGDLIPFGLWNIQGHVQFDTDNDFKTDVSPFRVHKNVL